MWFLLLAVFYSLDKQLVLVFAQGHIENPLVASGVFRT